MAAVRFIFYSFLFLVIVGSALLFIFRNADVVTVDFILFQSSSLSLGFWILVSFLIGSALGWIIALPGWFGLKVLSRRRSKQLQSKQEELLRLKGESAK